jgi:UDP-3-O-[3-hydroxymyristoyl] glucosamine N-acyltransferase
MKMQLSELSSVAALKTYRDASFSALGKTAHQLPQMLVFLESRRYLSQVTGNPNISCVITKPELAGEIPEHLGVGTTAQPRDAFYLVHHFLATQTEFYWKDFPTEIAEDAVVHPRAYVAPRNVRIGRETRIEPGAVIMERCIIGDGVVVRAGTALGTEGYEFRQSEGRLRGVVHAGGLRICDRVEIQANCAVDRPIFGDSSIIGEDTKLDNLVHVGHRVKIGQRCMLVAGVVIGGNVTIGNDVWIGPRAVISSGICIGDRAFVTIGSVVVNNVAASQKVTGFFAVEHWRFLDFMKLCWPKEKP